VRQAISELTSSGYLYKKKGRGTYVSDQKVKLDIKNYTGFTDSLLDGQNIENRNIISSKIIDLTDDKLREVFNIKKSTSRKIELAEIMYNVFTSGEIISLSVSYIPLPLFPNIIDDVNLKKLSHDILKGRYPLLPAKARSSMEVIFADEFDSQFLHIQTGQPLIKMENTLISKNNQIVEYIITKHRADKCKILFEDIK
jgi:DNA-binding GntR family transcriptional regulator